MVRKAVLVNHPLKAEIDLKGIVQEAGVQIEGCGLPVVIISPQDTIPVGIAQGNPVGHGADPPAEGDVMILEDTRLEDDILPVGIGITKQTAGIASFRITLLDQGPEFVSRQHIQGVGYIGEGHATVVVDIEVAAQFPFLGRDQDHPVGGPETINGRRTGVLQDGEGLNIIRVDDAQGVPPTGDLVIRYRDTIDHDQRIVGGTERRPTPDADDRGTARLADSRDRHAGHLSGQEFLGRCDRATVELFCAHRYDRTGGIFALDRSITDHDDLIENGSRRHLKGNGVGCTQIYGLGRVASIGKLELCRVIRDAQAVVPVKVGHRTCVCTDHQDVDTDQGVTIVRIGDRTRDLSLGQTHATEQQHSSHHDNQGFHVLKYHHLRFVE